MTEPFEMSIDKIQPSQLYISRVKLAKILEKINSKDKNSLGIIPIKQLGKDIIFTDGHTRALAAFMCGWESIIVEWETEVLDWEMYEICVQWCKDSKITSIADLLSRIVDHEEYITLWYDRCHEMQRKLLKSRKSV